MSTKILLKDFLSQKECISKATEGVRDKELQEEFKSCISRLERLSQAFDLLLGAGSGLLETRAHYLEDAIRLAGRLASHCTKVSERGPVGSLIHKHDDMKLIREGNFKESLGALLEEVCGSLVSPRA
ncbi:hypothetical protein H1R20_g6759, partial [Candolleomyces eurysporus]